MIIIAAILTSSRQKKPINFHYLFVCLLRSILWSLKMQWIQWHFTMATLMFLCHVFPVMSRPESMMFRYQTNFFNMLRLKSRLALDSNLNVTALLLSTNVPPSTVDTRAQYSNENLSSEANTEVPKKRLGSVCGVALKEFLTKAESAESHITPSRRSRIVGGEMVHHGEFPWMVCIEECDARCSIG